MDNESVAYFSQLPERECRSLLAGSEVGRVAWVEPDGVMILPVNYHLVDGHVVFHTAPGTQLARLAEGATVAFQVDEIDQESAIGWSVVLRGVTRPAPEGAAAKSWMLDERPLGIMIAEHSLTGRVIAGTKKDEK